MTSSFDCSLTIGPTIESWTGNFFGLMTDPIMKTMVFSYKP